MGQFFRILENPLWCLAPVPPLAGRGLIPNSVRDGRSRKAPGALGRGFPIIAAAAGLFFICSAPLCSQTRAPEVKLTGDLRTDLVGLHELSTGPAILQEDAVATSPSKKSGWLAAGMSLLIPGSGEFYAESYWKAAAFFVFDVVAWSLAYSNDHKGDEQTDFFQGYANQRWSVVQYAKYAETLAPKGKTYAWRKPGTETLSPWDQPWTQVNWDEINRMERDIGGYYSHTLPEYNSQQYYELIGKYPQFNQGWDDAPPAFTYGDPLTPHFLYYSDERGKANTYYETATTWVNIALINHLLSAIDAAWSAGIYNSNLHVRTGLRLVPTEVGLVQVPEVRLRYDF
jgi:hypothetical protein